MDLQLRLPADIDPHAIELMAEHGLVDLHIDSLISTRLFGYDVLRRHGGWPLYGRFFGLLDLPRLRDNGVGAAMWSITTNPFRTSAGRWHAWQANLTAFLQLAQSDGSQLAVARSPKELIAARSNGCHAMLCAVQGANAWQAELHRDVHLDSVLGDGVVTRATLVHLTDSALGATSSPLSLRRDKHLTQLGQSIVAALNRHCAFVDLAHAHPQTFWDTVAFADRDQPLIATHTGVAGVTAHWRNLDDRQVAAVANSGGVVGIIAATVFLRSRPMANDVGLMIRHLEHTIQVGGEASAAIGTDFDGAIVPPVDLRDGFGYLRIVSAMIAGGWRDDRIIRVCGGNFIAAWSRLRPAEWQPMAAPSNPVIGR